MIGPAAAALLAETRRRPGRLLLTGLAVLVATVFAAGTLLLSETLRGYVEQNSARTPVGAAAVVPTDDVPAPDLTGEDSAQAWASGLVERVGAVDGVAQAVGVWSAYLPVGGAGTGTRWEMQSDPMGGPLSRLPGPPVQGRVAADEDEVVAGTDTATRTGITLGSTLRLVAEDGGVRTVTVSGIAKLPSETINALVGLPATVAAVGGRLEQIDVAAEPGVDRAELSERVGAVAGLAGPAPTGVERRAAEVELASGSVTAVLIGVGVFSGLAVVAAAVIVASTFRIVLTQRRTQLALLRCVGARRGQLMRAVLAEAVLSGLLAGLLGTGIAVLLGFGLLAALRLGGVEDVPALVLWWPGLAAVLLVAVLSTVVAALAPAAAAARIPPVAALGSAGSGETGAPRAGRRLALAGVLVVAAAALGTAAVAVANPDSVGLAIAVVAASGMTAFAALATAGPVLVRGLGRTAGRLVAALGGASGRLAVANAEQVPRRTAATVTVLSLGVGLTASLLVALASAMADAERSVAENFPAAIVIATADPAAATAVAERMDPDPRIVARTSDAAVLADPAPGVEAAAARIAIEEIVAGQPDLVVQYAADARAGLESDHNTLRSIGLGLVGMTVLVAVVGVGVTLMLSVTERTRETGLLRAVGLPRRGVRAMVAWEAALSGAGAAVVGAVVGAGYGLLGLRVLGVGVGFVPSSAATLAVLVLGAVAASVLAGLVPAVRAGRVPPIRALQDA